MLLRNIMYLRGRHVTKTLIAWQNKKLFSNLQGSKDRLFHQIKNLELWTNTKPVSLLDLFHHTTGLSILSYTVLQEKRGFVKMIVYMYVYWCNHLHIIIG